MTILLTGATGLIGKEVGQMLAALGHKLHVVSRNPKRAKLELPFPAEVYAWAGGAAEFPSDALTGIDGVIHLAGESIADGRWTAKRKAEISASRVLGTRELVRALGQLPVPVQFFLHGSAIGFYGQTDDQVLTEESPAGSGFLTEVVQNWERETQPLAQRGTRLVIMRTGLVLSRAGGLLPQIAPLFARGLGGQLGSGQQWMSWIHHHDMARAIVFCLEKSELSGVFNMVAPAPARNDRFTLSLAKALGRSVFLPVPGAAIKLMMGEASVLALAGQRVSPRRLLDAGFEFQYAELSPALEELCSVLRDGQSELFTEQWLPRLPNEVFEFFADEKNLEEITPPFLNFHVLGKSTPQIASGTTIDYRLKIHGVPITWQSEIRDWQPIKSFVDRQVRGPYKLWHHTHLFTQLAGGTLITDRVLYRLPMGLLGSVVAGWKVTSDVRQIFQFRREKIAALFGEKQ